METCKAEANLITNANMVSLTNKDREHGHVVIINVGTGGENSDMTTDPLSPGQNSLFCTSGFNTAATRRHHISSSAGKPRQRKHGQAPLPPSTGRSALTTVRG